MLIWLDGDTNTKAKPQENFGRELMELFSRGVGYYTEDDVYAAARVFTGWNLNPTRGADLQDPNASFNFVYNANQHETTAKSFSFPIYADGSHTIPSRSASAGMQDGLDLIAALATHPETARRLATKLFGFFVSETVTSALTPLLNMGQQLLEPPNVAGWVLGQSWFSTGAMLARMNFASVLAFNQKFNLAAAAAGARSSPRALVDLLTARLTADLENDVYANLVSYAGAGAPWTGSDTQLQAKAPGLVHLILGSPAYQFV